MNVLNKTFKSVTITVMMLFLLKTNIVLCQSVSPFTGDMSTGIPLLSLPVESGPSVPISATYHAGVQVNQSATPIGLGWYGGVAPAIYRTPNTFPDDWNGKESLELEKNNFRKAAGVLYMKDHATNNAKMFDFESTEHRTSGFEFMSPAYDSYQVTGCAVAGSIEPHLFDFATTEVHSGDGRFKLDFSAQVGQYTPTKYSKKAEFHYIGDFHGEQVSRYYPDYTDVSTSFIRPNDPATYNSVTNNNDYIGSEYNDEDSDSDIRNRLVGSRFVEWFSNQEVVDNSIVDHTDITRSTANGYDMDGIGYFRILDANGITYHFSIPVYANYDIQGMYPLDNDYNLKEMNNLVKYRIDPPAGAMDDHEGDYVVYDMDQDSLIVEYKETSKYAIQWLLAAITGPDYVDENSNGLADAGDGGYWVAYDWVKWTDDFVIRTPEFGFSNAFNAAAAMSGETDPVGALGKEYGRTGMFSAKSVQMYYMNAVKSSTHTAVMVRDIRMDEHSADPYYDYETIKPEYRTLNITPSPFSKANSGTLYDAGGPDAPYPASGTWTFTIYPQTADDIELEFLDDFQVGNTVDEDYVKVYAGTDATGIPEYSFRSGINDPSGTYLIEGNAVTIELIAANGWNANEGFKMRWQSRWDNGRPKVTPQLKLSKVLLFDNDDFSTIGAPSSNPTLSALWDTDNTEMGTDFAGIYNSAWYATNQSSIENKLLKSVEFVQDYSLAKEYRRNINVYAGGTTKLSSPYEVRDAVEVIGTRSESGKLTLKEIVFKEEDAVKIVPSYLFDYFDLSPDKNPDYDPLNTDNWGFYKSDATSKGLNQYSTSFSAENVDAWCLRSITSPLGGVTNIVYESDRYSNVLGDDGIYTGARRTYPIASVSHSLDASDYDDIGEDWAVVLEDMDTDLELTVASLDLSTDVTWFIPYVMTEDGGDRYKSVGSGTITYDGQLQVNDLDIWQSEIESNAFTLDNDYFDGLEPWTLDYTGNGYLDLQYDAGDEFYGGGVRVAKIISRTCTGDSYEKTYEYTGGVASSEPEMFEVQNDVLDDNSNSLPLKLEGPLVKPFRLEPQVGYENVKVRSVSQLGTDNGYLEFSHVTRPGSFKYFNIYEKVTTEQSITAQHGTGCGEDDTLAILDMVDEFTQLWGAVEESKVVDAFGNAVSLEKTEYETSTNGELTENYHFIRLYCPSCSNPPLDGQPPLDEEEEEKVDACVQQHETVSILRRRPIQISKTTSFNKGFESSSEVVTRHPVTGMPTEIKLTDVNGIETTTESVYAFDINSYDRMAAKADDYDDHLNMLTAKYSSRTTTAEGITSDQDFVGDQVSLYEKQYDIWDYTGVDQRDDANHPYWVPAKQYEWVGPLSDYGLHDDDEFVAFDTTLSSIDEDWRLLGENLLFDGKRHILESRNHSNRYVSRKYGYDNMHVIAEAAGCNYESFTFTSFEDKYQSGTDYYFGGDVKLITGNTDITADGTVLPHTGDYMIKVAAGDAGPEYTATHSADGPNGELIGFEDERTYRASVWVHEDSHADAALKITLTDGESATVMVSRSDGGVQIGDWIQLNVDIDVEAVGNGATLKVHLDNSSATTTSYFDDLRLFPVEAVIGSRVVDERTGRQTFVHDLNNFATKFVFDEGGTVIEVWQEIEGVGFKKISERDYQFARTP